jgi:hypothetical protein
MAKHILYPLLGTLSVISGVLLLVWLFTGIEIRGDFPNSAVLLLGTWVPAALPAMTATILVFAGLLLGFGARRST